MKDTKSQIAFEEVGLGGLLKRYSLRVPPNQRNYAWTDAHVSKLLHDFAKAINEEGPYFLGTIVTIPRGEGLLEVVDGQQRLATTSILLAAIRDYLAGLGETMLVDSVRGEFLGGIDRTKRVHVPKLRLNLADNDLFRWIVCPEKNETQPEATIHSHHRLIDARDIAAAHVAKVVSALDQKEHANLLTRWIAFIEYRALVVLLRVPNDKDAFRMFETLNDRGLRTSQADLIKNYLFDKASTRMEEVEARWARMGGALESASDDPEITITFLRHTLITQVGHITEADVFDWVQKLVTGEQPAVTFSALLESLSNVYVATYNPDHEKWNSYPDSVRRAIEVFSLFGIKPMRALILAVAAKLTPNECASAFAFLVNLGVRLIVASSTRSGSVEEPLANAAQLVFDGKLSTAKQIREQLAALTPNDSDFQAKFLDLRVSNQRLARYYLRSLQMTANGVADAYFIPQSDKEVINLEHVLPKNPDGNWPTFKDDEVRQYATRLGNLALLRASKNSDLRSAPFSEKREVYKDSPFSLTSAISDVPKWTPQAIDARQKVLADLAVRTWTIRK